MWGSACCRGLKAEKIAARQAILPLIQAEEDARYVGFPSVPNVNDII